MIKKNLLFFLNLLIFFILFKGCATVNKKHVLQEKEKISSEKRFEYALNIVGKIPDYKDSPVYPDFKIKLSIKTKDFKHNLKTISEVKDISLRIQGYSLAAKKFASQYKTEQAKHCINAAQKEIFSAVESNNRLSYQLSVFYNDILATALSIDFPDFFEKKTFEFIDISKKYKTSSYILKPVLVSMKKYFSSFNESSLKYSEALLEFTENTTFRLTPEKKEYQVKTIQTQYNHEYTTPLFKSPAREKGQVLVQLCEIYLATGRIDKIPDIYNKILNLWEHSLSNPHLGKSVEIYFSKFVTILCKAGFYDKALHLAYSIPDVYPFYIEKKDNISKYKHRYQIVKITKYNKLGKLHRFKSLKNIAGEMVKTKGKEKTIKWINKNFDDKDKKIKIISSLSDGDSEKKKFPEKDLLRLYKKENNNKLSSNVFKNIYLPLLTFYFENQNNKAEKILEELLIKIDGTESNKDKALFYTKTASAIADFNISESRRLYKKALYTAFNLINGDTKHKLMIIQRLIFKYSLNNDFLYLDEYISHAQKLIENIRLPGHRDRLLEEKIDCALYVSRFLRQINKYDEASLFTDKGVEYANLLSVKNLKNSYFITLFSDYANNYNFKKAHEFFPEINITKDNKDYLIKKTTRLFVYRQEA
ncbi:MAG: hypothetical protein ACQEQS_01265 [Thermodesulfobacteriota bacterium]